MCYSYLPWFEIFYRLLNQFAELLNRGKVDAVRSLLLKLSELSVPWQGMLIQLHVDSADDVVSRSVCTLVFFLSCLCQFGEVAVETASGSQTYLAADSAEYVFFGQLDQCGGQTSRLLTNPDIFCLPQGSNRGIGVTTTTYLLP